MTYDQNASIAEIEFNSTAKGTITINGGSGDEIGLRAVNSGDATLLVDTNSGDHIINANIRLTQSDDQTWNIGANRTLFLNGHISGSSSARGFTKIGNGTVVLGGDNTVDDHSLNSGDVALGGALNINAGTLRITNAKALGTSGLSTGSVTVASGATLDIQGSITTTANAITISGTGFGSNGALTSTSGNNTFAGAITLGAASTIGSTVSGSLLTLTGGITNAGFVLTFGGAGNISVSTMAITGLGGLAYGGTGTLTLSAANTYSGATTITLGTLLANAANSLSATSAVNIAGGTLNVSGFTNTIKSLTMTSGTLALGINNNTSVLLTSNNAVMLGGTINVVSSGTQNQGIYTLLTGTSLSGSFTQGTVPAGYKLIANVTTNHELDLQAMANQTITNPATLGRLIAGQSFTGVTLGTLNNTSPANGAALNVSLSATDSDATPGTFTITAPTSSISANSSATITGNFATTGSTTLGTRNFSVKNIDNSAITGTFTLTTGSVDVIANRVFTQTATTPVAFGRIIIGQTSGGGTANFTTTGTHDTTANATVNSGTYTLGGVTMTNASNQVFNGPDALAHTGSLNLRGLTATGSGSQTGTITLTNANGKLTGEGLTGESDSLALAYSYDTVVNRVFTQTATNPVAFGRIISGQTGGSGTANFTTTGTNATTTNVTVNSGTYTLSGITVTNAGSQIFNGPDGSAHAGSLTLSGLVASGSGSQTGTITLTNANGKLTGEGLTGENDSLALTYSSDTVANRVFTQTATNPVAFGRIISGQTSGSGAANFTTTGTHDTTANVTVSSGTYTLGGVTVTNAGNQVFNGLDALAHTGTLNLSGLTATGSGSQTGTITLTNANGKLTGEGLTGESDSLALAYNFDTVVNRVFSQTAGNPVDLGRALGGHTASGTGNFTTTGTNDTTVNVTVNSGSTMISGVTVNNGSNQVFNGPDGSAHTGSVGLSLTATGLGTQIGTVTLTSGNGALTGEGLAGEGDALALAYSFDTVNQRSYTSPGTVTLGNFLLNANDVVSQNAIITTAGLHDVTTNSTLGTSNNGSFNGLSLTGGPTFIDGSNATDNITRTISGTLATGTYGIKNGTFSMNATDELAGTVTNAASVSYTANVGYATTAHSDRNATNTADRLAYQMTSTQTLTQTLFNAPVLTAVVGNGGSYAGLASKTIYSQEGSTAQNIEAIILDGANGSGSSRTVAMTWRDQAEIKRSGGTVPPLPTAQRFLISDVLLLTGMDHGASVGVSKNIDGTNYTIAENQTDIFALQISYTGGAKPTLDWLNPADSTWVLANMGDFDSEGDVDATRANNAAGELNFVGSFSAFQAIHGTILSDYLGAYGYDPASNVAWAVINHNSQFAVVGEVPEPTSLGLLGMGALSLLGRKRRRGGRWIGRLETNARNPQPVVIASVPTATRASPV